MRVRFLGRTGIGPAGIGRAGGGPTSGIFGGTVEDGGSAELLARQAGGMRIGGGAFAAVGNSVYFVAA